MSKYITPTANRNIINALSIFWFMDKRFNSTHKSNVCLFSISLSLELSNTKSARWHFSSKGIWALILWRAASLESESLDSNLSTCCSSVLYLKTGYSIDLLSWGSTQSRAHHIAEGGWEREGGEVHHCTHTNTVSLKMSQHPIPLNFGWELKIHTVWVNYYFMTKCLVEVPKGWDIFQSLDSS